MGVCHTELRLGTHLAATPFMVPLLFLCPKTNQQAPTGIETDVQSLSASWKAALKVNCPHCGEVHEISVRETYINGALSRQQYHAGCSGNFRPTATRRRARLQWRRSQGAGGGNEGGSKRRDPRAVFAVEPTQPHGA
jgi:hypothetical protein